MIKRLRRANALLTTTIILFAVSIIAASLTMYFFTSQRISQKMNTYYLRRIELSNEMNKTYQIILNHETDVNDNKLYDKVYATRIENGYYSFTDNSFTHKFSYEESAGTAGKCKYTLEFLDKSNVYTLEKVLVFEDNMVHFEQGEVYYVHANN